MAEYIGQIPEEVDRLADEDRTVVMAAGDTFSTKTLF